MQFKVLTMPRLVSKGSKISKHSLTFTETDKLLLARFFVSVNLIIYSKLLYLKSSCFLQLEGAILEKMTGGKTTHLKRTSWGCHKDG